MIWICCALQTQQRTRDEIMAWRKEAASHHACVHAKCMLQGDDDGEMTSEIERKFEITAEKAHEVLRRMSDEDCEALGFNIRFSRPDWMILTVLPVPPPPVRPSVMMDSSARCVACRAWGITRPVRRGSWEAGQVQGL